MKSTYTTITGKEVALNPNIWRGIRRVAKGRFDGNERLFGACWRQYRGFVNGAIDTPENITDVLNWLDTIASEKVNNSKSIFYIYGK